MKPLGSGNVIGVIAVTGMKTDKITIFRTYLVVFEIRLKTRYRLIGLLFSGPCHCEQCERVSLNLETMLAFCVFTF